MEYRRLGNSGLRVSEIGLGNWLTLGSSVDLAETRRIVERAFELGINLFDTADVYSEGEGERALGSAIAGLPRHQLVLATKAFFPISEHPNDRGLSRKHLKESVDASLRRLGTDYLDLHQCHRFDADTPLEETVCAYEDLIRQGKLLHWGVSLWNGDQVAEACRIADHRLAYRPIAIQSLYSLLRRDIEPSLIAACSDQGVSQIVFSALAQGVLSGKYRAGQLPSETRGADPQRRIFMQDYLKDRRLGAVEELMPLAEELGLTLSQLALAWCLRDPRISSAVVGVTRIEQLEDNVGASGVRLPDEIERRIDALFPADEKEPPTAGATR
ncbi:aldo/keto reductase family protein [Myxococcota bacterium]|nr:aldo/keto reductase family protein [Myxococcota bacterium]